jgi:hypothetical protein
MTAVDPTLSTKQLHALLEQTSDPAAREAITSRISEIERLTLQRDFGINGDPHVVAAELVVAVAQCAELRRRVADPSLHHDAAAVESWQAELVRLERRERALKAQL